MLALLLLPLLAQSLCQSAGAELTLSHAGAVQVPGEIDMELQGQRNGLAALGAAGYGFGPFHVMHANIEGGMSDRLLASDGADELLLHPPAILLVWRIGYFG